MYQVGQVVSVASFSLSLKYPWHDSGVCWFSSSPGVGWGCGGGCMAGAGPGFRSFPLPIMMKIKILNSIKPKVP